MGKNEYLIAKNNIRFNEKASSVEASDIRSFITPKPNKKFLIFDLKVWAYYKNLKKPSKINAWLDKNFGEPPHLFYKADAEKSVRKIKRYLADMGYVGSEVSYKVKYIKHKAYVTYTIRLAKPYRYKEIFYDISDTLIQKFVMQGLEHSLIKTGDIYNAYTLDDERDRITQDLRNNGYYYFNRNYIQFVIDSNFNNRSMAVTMKIFNRKKLADGKTLFHKRYFIRNVYVYPHFNPLRTDYDTVKHIITFPLDTNKYNYTFLCTPKHMFKVKTFNQSLTIKPGRPYAVKDVQDTYRNLFNYSILSTANILFDTVGDNTGLPPNSGYMDTKVEVKTGKLNRFSIETVGTNSSGDLGIRGNIVFMNKNLFKGAEVLRLSLLGGFEAQRLVNPTDSAGQSGSNLFNTFEAGFDAAIFFPRFLSPVRLKNFNFKYRPKTNMNVGYNYQLRPYYSRNIFNLGLGYSWQQSEFIKHLFTLVNLNYVNVNPTPEFKEILDNETNQRLKEQYSDHMIFGLKYSFIFNNQTQNRRRGHFNYIRTNIESSGNLLYLMDNLTGAPLNSEGFYEFLGVKYSQYIRLDVDYRHYYNLSENGEMVVFRGIVGTGVPFLNSNDMPYEKGFYSGGANGMRGWRFRTLGPGAFAGTTDYERLGDIQLEANVEYRFPVYKYFKSALFVDVGNIWTYGNNETFPGGAFHFNNFYQQLAMDVGTGIRLDFSYFIFRIDFAIPVIDPAYPEGQRIRVNYLHFRDIVGNFGIGYPF